MGINTASYKGESCRLVSLWAVCPTARSLHQYKH